MARRDLLVILVLAMVSSSLLLPKARGNSEGDALYSLRRSLTDTDNVLQSWDPNLVNPCTWFHITCNQDNRVTRVYVYVWWNVSIVFFFNPFASFFFFFSGFCLALDLACYWVMHGAISTFCCDFCFS